ncbi:MAG: alcohol dehydrogenase catalytic domain-containing protein [Halobacteriota archaeon]
MATTMDCLQLTERGGELERSTVPIPEAGPGEVLVEVEAASVGLTVRNNTQGDLAGDDSPIPRIPGHEAVGRIAATGPGVTHLAEGDRVGAYYYLSCGHCDPCLAGHDPLCENLEGRLGVDRDGGFAEYLSLPARNAIRLPESLDPVDGTVVPDAVATPYHVADRRANVRPGDDVLILGAGGGVGIHLVQMVQYFGGRAHALDRVGEKLERCAELGATTTVDTTETALADVDKSFDAVVDFTGSAALLEEATRRLRPHGRLVNLTAFPSAVFELSPRLQVMTEMEVVGSRYCWKDEYRRCGELVASGEIEPVVTEVVGLDGVQDLFDRIAGGEVVGRGAVVL